MSGNRRLSRLTASAGLSGAFLMAVFGGLLVGQSRTLAHSNGHESRTPAQCERLPGTEREGERAQCLACVSRPKPHHYHPDYPAGQRCRPDDGKP
jgi:hypothetical protein